MKIATTLDLLLNSIINLVLEKSATDPATPTQGRIYYNTTSDEVRIADGPNWTALGADMTPTAILNALLTVDGPGSGLDADLFQGLQPSAFATAVHTHSASDITDFDAAVDGRVMAKLTNDAVDATVDTIAEFTQLIKDNENDIANILSIKRFQQNVGDGSALTYTVTHNLNSLDALVQVVEIATGETVLTDVTRNGANSVVIGFGSAPSTDQYRVIIQA